MIDYEILQDIITDHKLCKTQENELAKVVELLKSDRLIELPCKVGDTVYEVCNNTAACSECEHFRVLDDFCNKFDTGEEKRYFPQIAETPRCEKQYFHIVEHKATEDKILFNLKWFGEIYFTTKEEAEAKLAELGGRT